MLNQCQVMLKNTCFYRPYHQFYPDFNCKTEIFVKTDLLNWELFFILFQELETHGSNNVIKYTIGLEKKLWLIKFFSY